MKKRLLVLVPLVVVLLAGAAFGGWYFVNREVDGFQFAHPDFTGKYTLVVPASNSVRRNLSVHFVQDGESEPVQEGVTYTLDYRPEGVTLEGNTLTVSSEVEESHTLYVTAEYGGETAQLKVKIEKDEAIADVAASPVEKEGWTLVYQDEFEDEVLDYSTWTPYYLRHWTDDDERTLANYRFEDGSLVLSAESALDNWSDQDSSKAFGIMTYERDNLHKFGEPGSGAVENRGIPEFDGYATKYGYFEMRLKMPSTRDGSHFAWWMVGTQSDQHSIAMLQGDEAPYYGHYSNETGEFDIIENYLNSLSKMKSWRPVIHPNGTTDYEYLWVPKTQISGDPSAEYHVYGFEWDEDGTKFYLDGELVQETDRSPNYPMMTILSLYTDAGMGADENIYPKEAYIDYFRVYKKDESPRATNVVMDIDDVPEYFYIPDEGTEQVQAAAYVTDQYDQTFAEAGVKWRLSETVDGFQPESAAAVTVPGVAVDAASGLVTISSEAQSDQDIFLTAYVSDQVKQTRHIKLSKSPAEPDRVQFDAQDPDGGTGMFRVEARVMDQYGTDLELPVQYQLSSDITGQRAAELDGVSLSPNGELVIADSVPDGTVIIVTAFYDDLYNHFIYKVESTADGS